METNIAYTDTQWTEAFESNFSMEKTKLKKDEGYYHYTSVESAIKILSGPLNEIVLYASHFLFLNDGEELINGLNLVSKELGKKLKINANDSNEVQAGKQKLKNYIKILKTIKPNQINNAPNHFIICFCKEGNLLTQWEYYGKECGVAIEFDLENCEYGGFRKGENIKEYINIIPRDIIYNDKKKRSLLTKINEKNIHNENSTDMLFLRNVAAASFMKHNGFQNEKEVRLLFAPIREFMLTEPFLKISKELVKFRESNGVLKPYLEVHIRNKENKLPIKSITVGPGQNQQLIYNAMLKFAQINFGNSNTLDAPRSQKNYNYEYVTVGDIEVRRSTIPFRG